MNKTLNWGVAASMLIASIACLTFPALTLAAEGAPAWFVDLPESRWEPIPSGVSLVNSGINVGSKKETFLDWNGATIDQDVGEMVFAANGGHQDSSENYVIGFHFKSDTPQWRLLSPASALEDRTNCATGGKYADGTAASTHSYGAHAYIPLTGEIALAGQGSIWCKEGWGRRRVWLWDRNGNAATRGWKQVQGEWGNGNTGVITAAAWDPVTQKLWWSPQYGDVSAASYDPTSGAIFNLFNEDDSRSGMDGTAATAGNRGLFVSIWGNSSAKMLIYKTTDPKNSWWRVYGGGIFGIPPETRNAPALMWHEASDAFLLYPGTGTTIYYGLPDNWDKPVTWRFTPVQAKAGGATPDNTYQEGLFHKCDIIQDMGNGQSALVLIPRETSIPMIYKLPMNGVSGVAKPRPPSTLQAD